MERQIQNGLIFKLPNSIQNNHKTSTSTDKNESKLESNVKPVVYMSPP